jgi:hypothetical protein
MRPNYDVFLSFKNQGTNGEPTRDCGLAEGVYAFLTSRGLKVFYSNVSLEREGVAAYKKEIDDALDAANVLVVIGTDPAHLESQWVRYEWDSFVNDILADTKPQGRVFVYVDDLHPHVLPRSLRQFQTIAHSDDSCERLYNFIANGAAASDARHSEFAAESADAVHPVSGTWLNRMWLGLTLDLPCLIFARHARLRVACPVFLKIGMDNRFFLIRVPRESHEHSFLPIGGVLKHLDAPELQALEFESDCPSYADPADRSHDLRGCIARHRLPAFRAWLSSGLNRESDESGLRREMCEELSAIGLPDVTGLIPNVKLRFLREVHQRPTRTPGRRYDYQYRRTVVMEIDPKCPAGQKLVHTLASALEHNNCLRLVSAAEIRRGRTADGEPIANNTPYLIGNSRTPGEPGEL